METICLHFELPATAEPMAEPNRAARPDGSQGRRIVRIYRADLEAWIKSKEATNAV